MDNFDLFTASTPQGNKNKPFPLFELDENGEIKLDLEANLDDFDPNFEVSNFKPVNKGLGFHHKESLKNMVPAKRQASSLREAKQTPAVLIGTPAPRTNSFDPIALNAAEIALLGSNEKLAEKPEAPLKELPKAKSADVLSQGFAWLVDTTCVAAFLMVTLAFFSFATNIHWTVVTNNMNRTELGFYLSGLFFIYYLVYFTVLDLQQTIGKSLFGIRLERTDGKRIKVKQTFTRAFVSLLSFALMGLPLTMDFQGKLSDTRVVR